MHIHPIIFIEPRNGNKVNNLAKVGLKQLHRKLKTVEHLSHSNKYTCYARNARPYLWLLRLVNRLVVVNFIILYVLFLHSHRSGKSPSKLWKRLKLNQATYGHKWYFRKVHWRHYLLFIVCILMICGIYFVEVKDALIAVLSLLEQYRIIGGMLIDFRLFIILMMAYIRF